MWGFDSDGTTLIRSTISGSTITNASYPGAVTTSLRGLALDYSGNIWALNGNSTLSEFTPSGATVTSPTPYSVGGLDTTGGGKMAIDGDGNVWTANTASSTLSEFDKTGTPLSPSTGYGLFLPANYVSYLAVQPVSSPAAIGIDRSGDVWVIGPSANNSIPYEYVITDILGIAAPVATVISPGVRP